MPCNILSLYSFVCSVTGICNEFVWGFFFLCLFQLVVVKQEDKHELIFKHFLVEDKNNSGGASYVDFLCHMHKEIRTLLS